MHNHQVSSRWCISCLYYSMQMLFYEVFYMLHKIMSIIVIKKLCEFWYAYTKTSLPLCCMCWIVLFELSSKICCDLNFWKPWFPVISFAPKNLILNRSTIWGWALKKKCRACRVVQSWFLEFSKLFYKNWSNLKRRDSLNIPFLNSNLHFKM